MEDPIAFELNRAIAEWRESMAQAPAMRNENLDELEEHLRDGMIDLRQRGLSEREAFLIAAGRMGSGELVAAEYGKVNRTAIWLDRVFWLLIGMQVWGLISSAVSFVCNTLFWAGFIGWGYDAKSHGRTIPTVVFAVVQLAAFSGSAAVCGWLFLRKGRSLGQWLAKVLQNRAGLVVSFIGFYVLSSTVRFLGATLYYSLFRGMVGNEKSMDLIPSMNMSTMISQWVWSGVLVGLTLFLARKRFRAVSV